MGALIFVFVVAFGTAFEVSRHRTAALAIGRARALTVPLRNGGDADGSRG